MIRLCKSEENSSNNNYRSKVIGKLGDTKLKLSERIRLSLEELSYENALSFWDNI